MNETTDSEKIIEQTDQLKLMEVNKAILDLESKIRQLEIALNLDDIKEKAEKPS